MAQVPAHGASGLGPSSATRTRPEDRAPGLSDKEIRGGRQLDALALALFVGFSLVMLYPYPLQLATHIKDRGDPLEYAWVLGYAAPAMLTDPLHVFDGNIFYPFHGSLAYSDSTLANVLLALPVILVTENPLLASNLIILSSFVLAGFGTYLLVHRLTGSRGAGIVAGAVFAFNSYHMDHMTQIPNVSCHWMPFVFYALDRFLSSQSRRWAAAFALFLALQVASSFYYAYAICLAVALYLACLVIWRPRRLLQRQVIVPFTLATLAVGIVLLAIGLPYFEVSERYGMVRAVDNADEFGVRLTNFLAVLPANRTWGQVERMVHWGMRERFFFPGLLALALAAAGLILGRPRSTRLLYGVVGLGALVVSMGPEMHLVGDGPPIGLPFPMPYRILYDYLPGFQSMRVPSRFAVVAMLAISVLAGLGFALLQRWLKESPRAGPPGMRRGLPVALTSVAVLVVLAENAVFPLPMEPVPSGEDIPAVYKWLREQPDKQAIVELPLNDNAFYQAPYAYYSTYHDWKLVNGYRSFSPPGYKEICNTMDTFPSTDSLALLADMGVKYVVAHGDLLPKGDLARRESRMQFYRNSLRLVGRFEDASVYEVMPPATSVPLDLAVAAPRHVGAGEKIQAGLLLGPDDWRMVALPEANRRVTMTAEWIGPDGERYHEQAVAAGPGQVFRLPKRVDFTLTAPASPGTYTLSVVVDPPLSPAQSGPLAHVVEVESAGTDSPPGGEMRLQAVSHDLPLPAVAANEPVPLRIMWRAGGMQGSDLELFVNVFDDGYRVWNYDNRQLTGNPFAADRLASGEDVLDVRNVLLAPTIPPGYYWVEYGVMDRATDRRLPILDPEGRLVEKVAAGRIRVGTKVHPFGAAAVCPPSRTVLGDQIALCGWRASATELRPGTHLGLSLSWQPLRSPGADYSVFVHLYDEAGHLVAQVDGVPGRGSWPTSAWQTNDLIEDDYELQVPAALPPGEYTLAVGMYDLQTMDRLPINTDAGAPSDSILLGRMHVASSP